MNWFTQLSSLVQIVIIGCVFSGMLFVFIIALRGIRIRKTKDGTEIDTDPDAVKHEEPKA